MGNEPNNLSKTVKIIKGEHSGCVAHVMQYDWAANTIKIRLKRDDPKTSAMLKFGEVVFLET